MAKPMIKLNTIKPNPSNPRTVDSSQLSKLKKSIQDFPKMMELRPMVVDAEGYVLGGNMRLKALKELGYKEVPDEWVKRAEELTEDERKRFIIADNVGFGDWDWDMLANEWDSKKLTDWGLELKKGNGDNEEVELIQSEASLQIYPELEYFVVIANSDEWDEIKERLKLKIVHRALNGKTGNELSTERVIKWEDFKNRYENGNSGTK